VDDFFLNDLARDLLDHDFLNRNLPDDFSRDLPLYQNLLDLWRIRFLPNLTCPPEIGLACIFGSCFGSSEEQVDGQ
jgi:hypothetical protein